MLPETAIIATIEARVNYYPAWTIGVTDDPDRRRQEHGNPSGWYQWDTNSEKVARNIEDYFLKKGMGGGSGGGGMADYVYIFI